jgi:hypothetical protein
MLNAGRFLIIVFVGLVSAHVRVEGQAVPNEYRLKAAFVYQFPQFVEWPSTTWQDAQAVHFCIASPNPFGSELEQLVRGESLNGRPLSVREIAGSDELVGCHVLFVGAHSDVAAPVLRAASGRPILTVGEADRFLENGGIIAMKIIDGRVQFEVNATNAARGGLRISSQLLSLALTVREGPP